MSDTLSGLGKTKSGSRRYAVAAKVLVAIIMASIGLCSAAVQDQGKPNAPACDDFAYLVNGGSSNSISGYRINPFTGNLEPVPGSPFIQNILFAGTVGQNGQLAVNSRNKLLYAVGEFLLSYPISPDGALSGPLLNVPTPAIENSLAVALDPGNHFLYVVGLESGVQGFEVAEATGELTPCPVPPSPVRA